jgi:hypothetical protein
LERIASFAREEVTEAEISGIIVHKKTAPNESAAKWDGQDSSGRPAELRAKLLAS